MLEWTGERFLPWLQHSTIAYEHLHRYAYASAFVKDKRVIDLACGEGYGAKMLSDTAASVVGIDIDDKTIEHAKTKYESKTLQFISGSICDVPIQDDHSFDVIVCFEAIEHVDNHDRLLSEVRRLLKPEGVFIVSTPNKLIYHDEAREENPFHVKELYFEEFRELLSKSFGSVQLLGQRVHPGSSIWPITRGNDDNRLPEFVLGRGDSGFGFIAHEDRQPLYFIAVASNSPIQLPNFGSVLVDHSDSLIHEKDRELSDAQAAITWRELQLKQRDETILSLEEAVKWREKQLEELDKGLKWIQGQIAELEKQVASHKEALEWRSGQVENLEKEKAVLIKDLGATRRQLQQVTGQLESIHASRGWKLILKLRRVRDSIFGQPREPGKSPG